MNRNDAQIGFPATQYKDTKAAIEALTGVLEGAIAYATDTNELGSYDGATWTWGGGGGHVIQDEGISLTARANLNFVGGGVTVTDDAGNNQTDVTIPLERSAADITSGTMATARLGSGTANATTALHGDSSYKSVREVLTAVRTYYVRTDGSDSNNGLANTAGGAFLTIQKAIDVVAALDLSIYNVIIQVANGTYTGANTLKKLIGAGSVTIQGDTTTPGNVVISTTSNSCFTSTKNEGYIITGVKVQTITGGSGFVVNGCLLTLGVIDFGSCANYHAYADRQGYIQFNNNYTISGGAQFHWLSSFGGMVDARNLTITFTTNPTNFSVSFAYTGLVASIYVPGNTFTNKAYATGKYYAVDRNSVIDVGGGGATYLPGNVAGTTASGGQYV